jgi:hypothetical protein
MDGWMSGWVDGWMGGWVDGWMSGWVDDAKENGGDGELLYFLFSIKNF